MAGTDSNGLRWKEDPSMIPTRYTEIYLYIYRYIDTKRERDIYIYYTLLYTCVCVRACE